MTLGGSGKTCQLGEFLSTDSTHTTIADSNGNTLTKCPSCSCPSSGALSSAGSLGADVVANDPNFPADVFQFMYGVPYTGYQDIKNSATVVADCGGLNTSSQGLIWVTGDCSITSSVGSFDNPVLRVVEDHGISITGGAEVFGIVFAFGSNRLFVDGDGRASCRRHHTVWRDHDKHQDRPG